ncbi:MAG: helix-turn-helix transcriptional regulator [Chloroflexi bacterium]|nr:helix-turn-helix transcriptional regulator [Chloroflexota bacterium]
MDREFFLGFIKVHILYHAAKGPVFGAEIVEELSRHGYNLGPGTLYPTLHRLENAGYLTRSSQAVGGKVRKYYAITEEGLKALGEAKKRIAQLVEEVLEEVDH